jgi:tripartite-type tricarboxylate transporter receptor subunit TctC
MIRFSIKALMLTAAITFGWSDIDAASAADASFKGKRINVIIGSSPGGGTDGTTRLVGRYLEKYLPGKPRLVYRNMPAGHGVKASNYFANEVPTDGTFWMGGSSSYLDANNLRKKVVKYNPTKYKYIGGIDRGGSVVVMRKSLLENLTDKSKKPVVAGVIDGSRTWAQMLLWGSEYLGWNIKFVVGYPGSAALVLAARKGEIDMFGTSQLSVHKNVSKTGEFIGLTQIGQFADGKNNRRTSFQEVPVITEIMKGKTKGLAKKAYEYWQQANQIDKWYALPPKTPANIVAAYMVAFAKAAKDPDFTKFGKLQFSTDFAPQTGPDVFKLVNATSYPDSDLLDFMRKLKVKYGLPANQLSDQEIARIAKEKGLDKKDSPMKLAELISVKREGREVQFKVKAGTHKVKVSSSRSKIVIDGAKAKRAGLKAGMNCLVDYPGDGQEAAKFECATTAKGFAALKKQGAGSGGVETTLASIKRDGREVHFKVGSGTHKVKVSGSRTKVSIAGNKVKRNKLKPGMKCTVEYPGNGAEALAIACK